MGQRKVMSTVGHRPAIPNGNYGVGGRKVALCPTSSMHTREHRHAHIAA